MKWENQYHELDEIAKVLCSERTRYYLWGTANIAKNMLEICGQEICIIGAVDANEGRWGQQLGEFIVQSPDVLKPEDGYIVLVTTSSYSQVKQELAHKGFTENINFFDYFVFHQIYQQYRHNRLYSRRIDISLTERCTLKCRKCNMFMPYFKNPSDLALDDVQKQVDLYFDLIDYVESLNLLGGEPFLYGSLAEVIVYIGENYRGKLEHFKIFTNGMILPDERLIEAFLKYDVEIQISDYTCTVPYQKRLEQLRLLLETKGVRHYTEKNAEWGDFGFPEKPNEVADKDLVDFFENCKAPFRGLYKGRVYYCHLETSAVRAGLYGDNENDYFDLNEDDENTKRKFLEFDFGYSRDGAVSFCKVCRGCYPQNKATVPCAEQM